MPISTALLKGVWIPKYMQVQQGSQINEQGIRLRKRSVAGLDEIVVQGEDDFLSFGVE